MTILYKEGATQAQEDQAHQILEALDLAYPGHPWWVHVYDGGFAIKNMAAEVPFGMRCKGNHASASEMKRDIILKAGELLERMGFARGRYDIEQEIQRVEGIPEKFQPVPDPERLPKIQFETVIKTKDHNLRTEPRGQVTEALKGEGI